MPVMSYQDLGGWQKSMDLVVECYRVANHFPGTETYGLTSQLRRAAVSIPANIAEGHGRRHTRDFIRYLSIAYGSLMEVETHMHIANRLRYIDGHSLELVIRRTGEIGRMLNGLIQSSGRKV